MNVEIISPPDAEPITLAEAKTHLRVDGAAEDALIGDLIIDARQHVENETCVLLLPQTIKVTAEAWGREICIPRSPIASIDSITYTDTNGATATLASSGYIARKRSGLTYLRPAVQVGWPTLGNDPVIEITCNAGFADAANVPAPFRRAMLLLIGHWFRNREAVTVGNAGSELPLAVEDLLARLRPTVL